MGPRALSLSDPFCVVGWRSAGGEGMDLTTLGRIWKVLLLCWKGWSDLGKMSWSPYPSREEMHASALQGGEPGAGQRHPAILSSSQSELSRQLGSEAAISHPDTGER